jgi:hypothetical protein
MRRQVPSPTEQVVGIGNEFLSLLLALKYLTSVGPTIAGLATKCYLHETSILSNVSEVHCDGSRSTQQYFAAYKRRCKLNYPRLADRDQALHAYYIPRDARKHSSQQSLFMSQRVKDCRNHASNMVQSVPA